MEEIAGLHEHQGRYFFRIPSYAIRVGHSLTKCAKVKISKAIRENNDQTRQDAEAFQALFQSDWTDRISSLALASLKQAKYNKPEFLPVTEDLVSLGKYLRESMSQLTNDGVPTYNEWRDLLEKTMVHLVVFNKRRANEVAKLLVTSFTNRPTWQESWNEEVSASLSALEKQLCARYIPCFLVQ